MICVRRMVIVASVVLSGCRPASTTRRQLEAQRQSYQRLRFDSATAVLAVMHRSADDDVSSVWTGVLEIGGPVETVRGDTVIMEPYYMLRTQTIWSGGMWVVRVNDKRFLPDLVLIPAGTGFHLLSPNERKRRGDSVATLVILGLIALDMYSRWPRG